MQGKKWRLTKLQRADPLPICCGDTSSEEPPNKFLLCFLWFLFAMCTSFKKTSMVFLVLITKVPIVSGVNNNHLGLVEWIK
jgi:hypothetical protein